MLVISQHMALPEEMHVIEDDRLTELPIHYAITERTNPEGMVVLMPSALAAGRADRDKIIYTRSSWQGSWPNAQVMSIPDPAIQIDNRLNGAWFINPHHDVISNLADIVKENAAAANIPHERIVFYGSSLGGSEHSPPPHMSQAPGQLRKSHKLMLKTGLNPRSDKSKHSSQKCLSQTIESYIQNNLIFLLDSQRQNIYLLFASLRILTR